MRICRQFAIAVFCFALLNLSAQQATPRPQTKIDNAGRKATCNNRIRFEIAIAPEVASSPLHGRLLVLMSQRAPEDGVITPGFGSDTNTVWIAARELANVRPGQPIELDPDEMAFPAPFSKAPDGNYWISAILDTDNNAAYRFITPGDLIAKPIKMPALRPASAGMIRLKLRHQAAQTEFEVPSQTEKLDFVSPALTAFWGRPIHMRGWIALPPSYHSGQQHYPVVYYTHGFGGDRGTLLHEARSIIAKTAAHAYPEMIWVLLDESLATGTHEFADSRNNGPWGRALTEELIPFLESRYRMDARPSGRFLTGHSSGGWATLWLQVNYPKIFGGTWSTAPDPADFRSFTGPNLTTNPPQNFYRAPDGHAWGLVRSAGVDVETIEQYAKQEAVLGPVGGQMASFEWVFSPRCPNGRPCPLFNRATGEIDPEVAKYWHEHYDISHIVQQRWPEIGSDLKGKIHVFVGTWDTFHLDGSASMLDRVLNQLGAGARFTYLDRRDHFDLYRDGLDERIAQEIYKVARPSSDASNNTRSR